MVGVMFLSFSIGFSQGAGPEQLANIYGVMDAVDFPAIFIKQALMNTGYPLFYPVCCSGAGRILAIRTLFFKGI